MANKRRIINLKMVKFSPLTCELVFFLLYVSTIQCSLNMLVICVLFRSFVDFVCLENHVCFES
jgi:hypothetical protein